MKGLITREITGEKIVESEPCRKGVEIEHGRVEMTSTGRKNLKLKRTINKNKKDKREAIFIFYSTEFSNFFANTYFPLRITSSVYSSNSPINLCNSLRFN